MTLSAMFPLCISLDITPQVPLSVCVLVRLRLTVNDPLACSVALCHDLRSSVWLDVCLRPFHAVGPALLLSFNDSWHRMQSFRRRLDATDLCMHTRTYIHISVYLTHKQYTHKNLFTHMDIYVYTYKTKPHKKKTQGKKP
jgi:hypothetical protein